MFSLEQLGILRAAEIGILAGRFPPGARVLELGAGTGQQALELLKRGFQVEAIEIPQSNYAAERLFPVSDFDGRHVPFPDGSFDIVFSSNVLEHVSHLPQVHTEIRRVLRPGGCAVHVLPTHSWRFWTTLSAFPTAVQRARTVADQIWPRRPLSLAEARRVLGAWMLMSRHIGSAFLQRRHGERGNVLSETWLFHPSWWRSNFRDNGFEVMKDEPMGIFYTGNMTFGTRWSVEKRARLARILGSACHIFELKAREP